MAVWWLMVEDSGSECKTHSLHNNVSMKSSSYKFMHTFPTSVLFHVLSRHVCLPATGRIISGCHATSSFITVKLPRKTKRQYLLTLQVNRECILALQNNIIITEQTAQRDPFLQVETFNCFPFCKLKCHLYLIPAIIIIFVCYKIMFGNFGEIIKEGILFHTLYIFPQFCSTLAQLLL